MQMLHSNAIVYKFNDTQVYISLFICREDGDNEFMNIVANKLTEKVSALFIC